MAKNLSELKQSILDVSEITPEMIVTILDDFMDISFMDMVLSCGKNVETVSFLESVYKIPLEQLNHMSILEVFTIMQDNTYFRMEHTDASAEEAEAFTAQVITGTTLMASQVSATVKKFLDLPLSDILKGVELLEKSRLEKIGISPEESRFPAIRIKLCRMLQNAIDDVEKMLNGPTGVFFTLVNDCQYNNARRNLSRQTYQLLHYLLLDVLGTEYPALVDREQVLQKKSA